MLTDLYLTGYVEDRDGKAYPVRVTQHDDPVLHDALTGVAGQDWAQWIARRKPDTAEVVGDQLEAMRWVHGRRRRTLGIIPARAGVYDEDMVGGRADRVTAALRNIVDGRPAEPRPLALGLLAVQAQLPVVDGFMANPPHREQLCEMILAAIEPILGLHHAIHVYWGDVRSNPSGACGGGAVGCAGGV